MIAARINLRAVQLDWTIDAQAVIEVDGEDTLRRQLFDTRPRGAPVRREAEHRAGLPAFEGNIETIGIGGVHRGHPEDQSADLAELSRSAVAVFCAGPKIILDLPQTLERLESLGVPVLGYGCDEVPAFYTRLSGCRVSARVDGPEETARTLAAAWETGTQGVLVCIPPPRELADSERFVEQAIEELGGLGGSELTPRLLARVAELSGGRSLDVNVDLVVNNARVAAQVARAHAGAG